jgi:hypothetical protein
VPTVLVSRQQPRRQPVVVGDKADFSGRDELFVSDRHPVELALKVMHPEVEKPLQARETRVDVIFLPDEAL